MQEFPLVSIITTVFNNEGIIGNAIRSVLSQDYKNIEYIIVDGGSTDGTVDIINKYKGKITKFISEKDKGIYDGMNKGIKMASGEIIGILNSDDFYNGNNVIGKIVSVFQKENCDCLWGDLVYVGANNTDKIVRYWKSSKFSPGKFQNGWMPPHSTFFVKKRIYQKYGFFNLDFPISADYEIMLRFLERYKISSCYIPEILVKMRIGGKSNKNIFNIFKANMGCYRAWRTNGLSINPLRIFFKPLSKIFQYFKK